MSGLYNVRYILPKIPHATSFQKMNSLSELGDTGSQNPHETVYGRQLRHDECEPYPITPGLYQSEHTMNQLRGATFMALRESTAVNGQYGGLICDDLGVGKTFLSLTTIAESLCARRAQGRGDEKTLVVSSANVMFEWKKQVGKHFRPGVLRICMYYGPGRKAPDPETYDMLLTSFGVVRSEYSSNTVHVNGIPSHFSPTSPFNRVFERVIVDEIHNIRTETTALHKAVCALHGQRHWGISGTPICNSVNDLYALFKFLGAHPYCQKQTFREFIGEGIKKSPASVIDTLSRFMLPMEIRRGKASLGLPPLTEQVHYIQLSEKERLFYTALRTFSQDTVRRLFETSGWLRGTGWAKAYTNLGRRARQCILSVVLRLRQACVHPQLAIDACASWGTDDPAESRLLESAASRLIQLVESRNSDGISTEECAVCLTNQPDEVAIPCGHTFCGDCLAILLAMGAGNYRCPMCRKDIDEHKPIAEALKEHAAMDEDSIDIEPEEEPRWESNSSKINFVVDTLRDRLQRDPTAKALIFSQWRGVLDNVGRSLTDKEITFLRVDGTVTSAGTRSALQDQFNTDPAINAMVCSLNCSTEGINLQGANLVFIMDPWWNAARAKQAGNRAHRVGQNRPVEIFHLIAEGTIEDGILDIQQRKQAVSDAANGQRLLNEGWDTQIRRLLEI